jgi:hypothetical protein
MAVLLNEQAVAHAKHLIEQGHYVLDAKGSWSEEKPSRQEEDEYLARHGFADYGQWHLGINDEANTDTKARYEFPYGDFRNVLRSGVVAAEARAGQYKHAAIEAAASELLGMLDEQQTRH